MKVIVVMPARNEAEFIEQSLRAIQNQTKPPKIIVVVNDGSTDDTETIAKKMNVRVVNREDRGHSAIDSFHLSEVYNDGFNYGIQEVPDYTHIITVDGDTILPENYIESIINQMDSENVHLAAGIIAGEEHFRNIRHSGRVITRKLWKISKEHYYLDNGWEQRVVYHAIINELKFKTFINQVIQIRRKTGENYQGSQNPHSNTGKSYDSLGYFKIFVLAKAIQHVIKFKDLTAFFKVWSGYLKNSFKYERDILDYYRKKQFRMLKRVLTLNLIK